MTSGDTDAAIAAFTAKFLPDIASATSACRKRLHALVPRGFELVYDNYNALVFGFGPSERSSDAVLSIAVYPKWVTLFFLQGVTLDDPQSRLEGSGTQVRSIRLAAPSDLDDAYVRMLIAQAMTAARAAFSSAPPRRTIIKSISAKQRPRRPTESVKGGGTKGSSTTAPRPRAVAKKGVTDAARPKKKAASPRGKTRPKG